MWRGLPSLLGEVATAAPVAVRWTALLALQRSASPLGSAVGSVSLGLPITK